MCSVRFIHTGDWHLGAGFGSLPKDVTSERQRQQRRCVEWLIERAVGSNPQVDLLLIAGDVFDTPAPGPAEVGFLESQLRRLSEADVQTFIIPGTGGHDAYRSQGVWDRVDLSGAHLFREAVFREENVEGFEDVKVWGVACDPARPDVNLLSSAAALTMPGRSIGLYHGGLAGRCEQEGERGNAFQAGDVQRAPFDYLALGHYHRLTAVLNGPRKKAYYSGSPTAIGFRDSELGPRHFLQGQLSEDGAVTLSEEQIPSQFGLHRAETLDCTHLSLGEVSRWLAEKADPNTYMTVSLTGIVPPEVMSQAREVEEQHRNSFGYLKVSLAFEDLSAAEENEYLRLFRERAAREIEDEPGDARRAVLEEALLLGTEALLRGAKR